MHVYEVDGVPAESDVSQVLAIGKFDGVHIGHQAILDTARKYLFANTRLAVMCFHPHPRYVLTGDPVYSRQLTPHQERVRILSEYGVEALYVLQFNPTFATIEAEDFVKQHLSRLNLRQIVVGDDFRFGQGGKGTASGLRDFAAEIGVDVSVVTDIEENGTKVSSSQIRRHLAEGRVEAAEALLGRAYAMTGIVVHGDKRGRTIGFPTANLGDVDAYVMPKAGVYAVSVAIPNPLGGEQHFAGVLNAGVRPTVDGTDFRVEVHLLGFAGDLYGEQCRVSFLSRIRDEMRFGGLDELKAQIEKDCAQARVLLGLPNAKN